MGASLEAVGQLLSGTYQIERKIAEGGMGVVYEASHVRLPRRFAVKVLGKIVETGDTDVVLERFKREAQVASALKNPHVVQIYDYQVAEGDFPYIVMELLEGEDLAQRIKRAGRFVPEDAVRIVAQIADALDAAHAIGIIHRDLKPANVFLNAYPERDFVKVLDFGVSKMVDLVTITKTDALVGTPLYMSPEQAGGGRDITHASDLFALGSIAYELLTGNRPFTGKSIPAILYQVVHEEPPPLASVLGSAARGAESVLARALAKDPAQRYASAAEFARALREGLASMIAPSATDDVPTETSDQHTMRHERRESTTQKTPLRLDTPTKQAGPNLGGPVPLDAESRPTAVHAPVDRSSEPTRASKANAPRPTPPSSMKGEVLALPPMPKQRSSLATTAIGGVGVLLVATLVTIAIRRQPEPVIADVVRAPEEQPPIPATHPSTVKLTIDVTPPGARVFLDDDLVQGGAISVPWQSRPRSVRASAAGFRPIEREVDATNDRTIEITLDPESRRAPARKPARSKPARPVAKPAGKLVAPVQSL